MIWFKKKAPEPTLEEELIISKARLAKYKFLPEGDFTIRYPGSPMILEYGVDRKQKQKDI